MGFNAPDTPRYAPRGAHPALLTPHTPYTALAPLEFMNIQRLHSAHQQYFYLDLCDRRRAPAELEAVFVAAAETVSSSHCFSKYSGASLSCRSDCPRASNAARSCAQPLHSVHQEVLFMQRPLPFPPLPLLTQ